MNSARGIYYETFLACRSFLLILLVVAAAFSGAIHLSSFGENSLFFCALRLIKLNRYSLRIVSPSRPFVGGGRRRKRNRNNRYMNRILRGLIRQFPTSRRPASQPARSSSSWSIPAVILSFIVLSSPRLAASQQHQMLPSQGSIFHRPQHPSISSVHLIFD